MGKTLTSIITLGAAIAINVIPGVGQVISGTLGAAFSGTAIGGGVTALGYAAAQAVTGLLTLGLTAAGLQAGAGLLGLGPSAPKAQTTETALKTPRPPRVTGYGIRRLYGSYVLYETASNGTAVDVFAWHDGKVEIVSWYLGDDPVTLVGNTVQAGADGRYGDGKVNIYWTDGSSPGAGIPALAGLLPGVWDANRRGDGVALMAATFAPVKSKKFLEIYPNSTPALSVVAKLQRCPDLYAADPTDESQWTWTENAIRHAAHYELYRKGSDYATKIAPTLEYWRRAQDVCDQAIALKAGGTEPRYRSCVVHNLTDPHKATTASILATCDGWMAPRADGALIVYAGEYYEPTVTIDDRHIVSYDWDGIGVDDDTAVNEISLTYVSSAHDYNSPDTDPWTDEADIAERGQVLSESLELQVPSHSQARRLAKRKQSRNLAENKGAVTTNVAGRIVRGHRYIHLLIREAGVTFYDGPVEITGLTRNLGTGGVTFSWVKADPNIDAWNPATEEGDPAPVGNRVAREPLSTPSILSATADFSDIGESGGIGGGTVTGVRIIIEASGPTRDDLTWYARWRVGSGAWSENEYPDADAGAGVELVTEYVPYGTDVDVEVAYGQGDGRISPWSATTIVDTSP